MTKLSEPQERMLRTVVYANGGGIPALHLDIRTLRALVNKGLVQGKLGDKENVVHTRAGLDWVRSNIELKSGK